MRLSVPEVTGLIIDSSVARLETFDRMKTPKTRADLIEMLGDETNAKLPVYHTKQDDPIVTVATGIFDCVARTWTIYGDNPKHNEPLMVLPLVLKKD